ncbi:hypothetical protein Fmac_031871 [Flemingia macrophylla]|uniref:Uncharacterized protein n=1 Tax=Flemingia macrophylla TaxID=520843 RepID=A0ABD1L3B0_9FABA
MRKAEPEVVASLSGIIWVTNSNSNMRGIPIPPPSNESTTLAPTTSVWHSPVPYLFGGLATIMALIVFALLIIACSYWRLTHTHQQSNHKDPNDHHPHNKEQSKLLHHNILVIMPGDHKPTFLATPSSSSHSLPNHFHHQNATSQLHQHTLVD